LLAWQKIREECEMRTTPGKSRSPDKKNSARNADTSEPLSHPDLLTVTIDTRTGQIIKIEGANGTRAKHELSDEEKASLAKTTGRATLEAIIEEAFEAGIACGLGEGADEDEDEPVESEKDANLRHLLLRPLIENTAVKRLMRRDVLSRAILKTLIGQGTGARG
jgi:hypothetical protein